MTHIFNHIFYNYDTGDEVQSTVHYEYVSVEDTRYESGTGEVTIISCEPWPEWLEENRIESACNDHYANQGQYLDDEDDDY